jgi:hypothetical protein
MKVKGIRAYVDRNLLLQRNRQLPIYCKGTEKAGVVKMAAQIKTAGFTKKGNLG